MATETVELFSVHDLNAILARAKAGRGAALTRVFVLNRRLDQVPRALVAVDGLTSPDLRTTEIGQFGALAILDAWADSATSQRRR